MKTKDQLTHLYNITKDLSARLDRLEVRLSLGQRDKFNLDSYLQQGQLKDLEAIDELPLADGYALLREYAARADENAVVKENFTTKEPSEIYMDGWNDREAKAEKELAAIREERDNYFDRLHELRQELANVQNLHEGKVIKVPFELDEDNDITLSKPPNETVSLYRYCRDNDIDQKRIKRILLEMKAEDE